MIPYGTIFLLIACTSLFAAAAEQEGHPRIVGALASLGAWFLFTSSCIGGVVGGLLSQVVLIVVWGCLNMLGDWWKQRRKA